MAISAKELITLLNGMAEGKYTVDMQVLGHAANTIEELAAALDPFARYYETRLSATNDKTMVIGDLRASDFKKAAKLTGSR